MFDRAWALGGADLGLPVCFAPHPTCGCGLSHHYLLPASLPSPPDGFALALPQPVCTERSFSLWSHHLTPLRGLLTTSQVSQLEAREVKGPSGLQALHHLPLPSPLFDLISSHSPPPSDSFLKHRFSNLGTLSA